MKTGSSARCELISLKKKMIYRWKPLVLARCHRIPGLVRSRENQKGLDKGPHCLRTWWRLLPGWIRSQEKRGHRTVKSRQEKCGRNRSERNPVKKWTKQDYFRTL